MSRYIDADKAIKDCQSLRETYLIDSQPTAGVRENATGEWIESMHRVCGEREYKCSNCNKVIWSGAIDGYHFCPKCGADMRGEA